MDVKQLTAACGIACWECEVYEDNITEEIANNVAAMMGMKAEDVSCDGCRSDRGCSIEKTATQGEGCKTKKCVEGRDLHNCSECKEMPCEYLMPVADFAASIPHNTKLYNLSRIRLKGLESWAEEAGTIQKKYFEGKFVYGESPAIQEEN